MTNNQKNTYNSYVSITDIELYKLIDKGIRCNSIDSFFLKGFKGIDIKKQVLKSSIVYAAYKAGVYVSKKAKKQEKDLYKKEVIACVLLDFIDMKENIVEIRDKELQRSDFFEIKEVNKGFNFALYLNGTFLKYFFYKESTHAHIYKYY
jgi:hypothetical protein